MFWDIFKFELNFHRRQYLVYVISGVLFLLLFLATTTPNVQISGGETANLNLNATYTIMVALGAVTFMSVLASIAFASSAVLRDFEFKTAELFFSRPISKFSYMYGRFFGTLVFTYLIYFAGSLGVLIGEFMPWLDQERIGAFSLAPYIYTTLVIALPTLFIFSAIFFCIATVTRSLKWTYAGAIGLLMLTFLVDSFTEKETVQLTSMLDPFGTTAIEEVTRYWTAFEKNTQLPAVEGALLVNRVVWFIVGLVVLVATYPLFSLSVEKASGKSSSKQDEQVSEARPAVMQKNPVHQQFGFAVQLQQLRSQIGIDVKSIIFSIPFLVMFVLGFIQVMVAALGDLGNIFGTSVYPTTNNMLRIINSAFSLSLLAVLIYSSGEMMARERDSRSNGLLDAMPFPNWVMLFSKLISLGSVVVMMILAATLGAICVQLYKGYYDINLLQYLAGSLFFFQFPIYFAVVLAVSFYVLSRNKYMSMFLMVLYFVLTLVLPAIGFEHHLYLMNQLNLPYSDFNGYQQNLEPYLWQTLYWSLFGCLLLIAAHLLWPRGSEDDWSNRMKLVRQRMSKPVVISLWGFSTAFLLVGMFIYYNTVILNEYVTNDDREAQRADYEKSYKQYDELAMPTIEKVYVEVDIFPSRQEATARGSYVLRNHTGAPLDQVHFTDPLGVTVNALDVPAANLTFDEALGYRIYRFDKPLMPDETMEVKFDIDWLTPGFANNGHTVKLTSDGTFFDSTDILPLLGYQAEAELQDNNKRREHDLPPVQRLPDIDDEAAYMESGLSSDRVWFEAIVSTSKDQIAIAPGYLQSSWEEDGRAYFHYKMDAPIWDFYSFLSADYEVKKDNWNDVSIEVYYKHDYNVDRMIEATKASLDYYTENFSPYQYRQFRILEFPRYQGTFAQSFPNTIPFSEQIGFTADLRDESKIDYVYYVTAHEMAHQWWGHQAIGANVQGSTMIIESLAQYSALMVMEKTYGKDVMKRFLSYELDRYLRDRGGELIEELPLYRVENQQYIHYRKGSLVLYALKDYIGEENLNRALANFIDAYAFKGAPYPTTRDLIAMIRAEAPAEYQDTITDLLERIILFDLSVEEATARAGDNGQYEVTINVAARKYEADGEGQEVEIPISDWIDIGVLGEVDAETDLPEVIHLERVKIDTNQKQFTFLVDKKPDAAGIDPLNKLIDRNPENNIENLVFEQ